MKNDKVDSDINGKKDNLIQKLFKKKTILSITDRINMVKIENFFRAYDYNADMGKYRKQTRSVVEFLKYCMIENNVDIDNIWLDFLNLCDNLRLSPACPKEVSGDYYKMILDQLLTDLGDTDGMTKAEKKITNRLYDSVSSNIDTADQTMDYVRNEFDKEALVSVR